MSFKIINTDNRNIECGDPNDDIIMNGFVITGSGLPLDDKDLTSKFYVDSSIGNIDISSERISLITFSGKLPSDYLTNQPALGTLYYAADGRSEEPVRDLPFMYHPVPYNCDIKAFTLSMSSVPSNGQVCEFRIDIQNSTDTNYRDGNIVTVNMITGQTTYIVDNLNISINEGDKIRVSLNHNGPTDHNPIESFIVISIKYIE